MTANNNHIDLRLLFGTDAKAVSEGVEVHLGGPAYITLRPTGQVNRAYAAKLRELVMRNQTATGEIDFDADQALTMELYSLTVATGWRGVALGAEALEFSPANFVRVARELPKFWEIVRERANDFALFRLREAEQMGKQ